ncbi:MAG: glycerophosphodiester phosphodiesterase family protein [Bacteroidales bacterium]|nr:glycerophosphodiester phosphodiesterase family protein [Bacteroidales bacterium]
MKRLSLLALLLVAACAPKPGQTRVQTALAALHDPSSKYVVVVAHRGDWRNYPENSIGAIESVIKMGADIVEIDLKLTKDSVLVLSHDHTLNRCTTGSGRISDYTYEEILQFDLKAGHGIGRPGIKMPTLREALEVCKDRILVNVDQGYDYYDQVLAITEELGVTDQILIKSGKSLSEVKAKLEEHPHNMMYMPVVTAAAAEKMGAFNDYIAADEPLMAYELCFGELNDDVRTAAKRILDDGSKLWVNTIWASLCGGYEDDAADKSDNPDTVYGPILDLGASILQTDRPQLLISYLESKGRHSLLR